MPKPTGPENPELWSVIGQLRKSGVKEYKAVADMLQGSRRKKAAVNVHTLGHLAQESRNIVVPWKVLGAGEISSPVRVFSFSFSQAAREKITAAGGECLQVQDIIKEEPKHIVVLRDIERREE